MNQPYSCTDWGEGGILNIPSIIDGDQSAVKVIDWFENTNTNKYPLAVFIDHEMKIFQIIEESPTEGDTKIIIDLLLENVPDSGGTLGIEVAEEYQLHRIYPNPFNPVLNVDFQLEKSGLTKVEVYDLQGNQVDVVYSGFLQSGNNNFSWDAEKHPSGTYFVSLISGESKITTSVVLLK